MVTSVGWRGSSVMKMNTETFESIGYGFFFFHTADGGFGYTQVLVTLLFKQLSWLKYFRIFFAKKD